MKRRQFLTLGAAALLTAATIPAFAADKTIEITYVKSWPSSNLTTHIAGAIIEKELGHKVKLTSTDPGPMWAAVASGRADAMLTAWLPTTHQTYWEKYQNDVENVGQITTGTWLGLAVPTYVTVDSIEQLDAHHEKFKDRIVGIEAGAGLMINTEKAIKAYNLKHMKLLTSSTAAMQAQLKRAVARKDWIVVTAWKPLGIWARFDLKPLADPKNIYGKEGHIDAIIHPSLKEKAPDVVAFLRQFKLPIDDIQAMMVELDNGEPFEAVTQKWLDAHKAQIAQWVANAKQ